MTVLASAGSIVDADGKPTRACGFWFHRRICTVKPAEGSHRRPRNIATTQGLAEPEAVAYQRTAGVSQKGFAMSLGTILIIILILILLGVIPSWGYSGSWGYGPSGIVGTILVIVIILLLLGRI